MICVMELYDVWVSILGVKTAVGPLFDVIISCKLLTLDRRLESLLFMRSNGVVAVQIKRSQTLL